LHLSQAAVSQHVRRLEAAVGRPLVERYGRGSAFTADGQRLLQQARRILEVHDESLRMFEVEREETLTIGSTEHAASQLLPALNCAFMADMPGRRVKFRVDRGSQLREDLAKGRIDLALLFGAPDDDDARSVGHLELTWYSAPGWSRPRGNAPVPLVAFDDPCALRTRALETLAAHGLGAELTCEAPHLAGVQAGVRAGLGTALMATLGICPEGLSERADLPVAEPLELSVRSRPGLPAEITGETQGIIRQVLEAFPIRRVAPLLAVGA
jgi:DNA-binding transcriptional LysR family regulator